MAGETLKDILARWEGEKIPRIGERYAKENRKRKTFLDYFSSPSPGVIPSRKREDLKKASKKLRKLLQLDPRE